MAVLTTYMVLIHNRYMPIQEGWFSEYGRYMAEGRLPYRDFYFFGQPVPLFISALLVKLGDRMIYMRYYGLAERLLLYVTVYVLLSRRFSATASCIATLTSAVFFLAYATDAFYSYLYTCLLFLLLAAASLQAACLSPNRRQLFLILAGACASLSFFSKQSNGALGTAAIFLCVLLLSRDFRRACADLTYTALGWAGAAFPFIAWLSLHGIWRPYFNQVFQGAIESKGTFHTILLQCLLRMREPKAIDTAIVLALIGGFLVYEKRIFLRDAKGLDWSEWRRIVCYTMAAAFAVFLPFAWRLSNVHAYWMAEISMYVVRLSACWILVMVLWLLYRRFFGAGWCTPGDETVVILAIVGAAWLYGSGASFMFEQQAMIPGLSLLLAFFYDRVSFHNPRVMRNIIIAMSLFMLTVTAMQKYRIAFTWIGWREQVAQSPGVSHWKELAGFRPNEGSVRVYDTILDEIAARTEKNDTVFTFPVIPMFNYVTHHHQPTYSLVHYWDVCPDWLAIADAQRLRQTRPRIIVNVDLPEDIWEYHEKVFRMDHRSGQREIQKVIDEFVASGDYKLIREFNTAFFEYPLYVWWREK